MGEYFSNPNAKISNIKKPIVRILMLKGATSDAVKLVRGNEVVFTDIKTLSQNDIIFNYFSPDGTENGVDTYKFGDGKGGCNSTLVAKTFQGDATSVNGHTVGKDVPNNATFTDTTYSAITDSQIDAICTNIF